MPAKEAPRCISETASSFFAGKPRSYRDRGAIGVRSAPKTGKPIPLRYTGLYGFATAAQPNGGKPPRHRVSFAT